MRASACPTCGAAPVSRVYAPFCSRRCADIDLQRWFAGVYAIPASEEPEPEMTATPGDGQRD